MAAITIEVPGFECERCGHRWIARKCRNRPQSTEPPRICPGCKSPWWDTPKRAKNPPHATEQVG